MQTVWRLARPPQTCRGGPDGRPSATPHRSRPHRARIGEVGPRGRKGRVQEAVGSPHNPHTQDLAPPRYTSNIPSPYPKTRPIRPNESATAQPTQHLNRDPQSDRTVVAAQGVELTRGSPIRGLPPKAHKVNESPHEQDRLDKGLRKTKPVLTMVFSKSSSEPLMNR